MRPLPRARRRISAGNPPRLHAGLHDVRCQYWDTDAGPGDLDLPDAFVGTNFTSEVLVSRHGKFVYAANRLHHTIAVLAVGGNDELTRLGETWTRGDYSRNFNIEPSGRFMYVCNHRGDSVTTFRVEGVAAR